MAGIGKASLARILTFTCLTILQMLRGVEEYF